MALIQYALTVVGMLLGITGAFSWQFGYGSVAALAQWLPGVEMMIHHPLAVCAVGCMLFVAGIRFGRAMDA